MAAEKQRRLFVGVDVGTGSARAGLFTESGTLRSHSTKKINTWINEGFADGSYEQSTDDIWQAVCSCVKDVCQDVPCSSVSGLGFDATCSLVALDCAGQPVTVSPSLDPQRNVILWQDHRAIQEAEEINATCHPVLNYVGGRISPEMEPPKLLWLKRHLPKECWERIGHVMDLADYLTYKATGDPTRSLCTLVCKWCYVGHVPDEGPLVQGWNVSFWHEIGLEDLTEDDCAKIGQKVQFPGQAVGRGLTLQASRELGLLEGTTVATSLIDAHAGGLGMVGADLSDVKGLEDCPLSSRLAVIAGTSSCLMASSPFPIFVPGVWGPYFSAMVPDHFLSEGGQSAAGSLLDHLLQSSKDALSDLENLFPSTNQSKYEKLSLLISSLSSSRSLPHPALLTCRTHVLPDFCGNRSPLADPHVKGMISGLTLSQSIEELAVLYLAAIQALSLSTRHILEAISHAGHQLALILLCGGLRHNQLYVQTLADVTGLPVLLPDESEAVLLGAAVIASASTGGMTVLESMKKMTKVSAKSVVRPSQNLVLREYYEKKYAVLKAMYDHQKSYEETMHLQEP